VENSVDNVDNYQYKDFITKLMFTILRKSQGKETPKMLKQ